MLHRHTFLLIAATLSLTACSSVDSYFGGSDAPKPATAQTVDLNANGYSLPDDGGSLIGADGAAPAGSGSAAPAPGLVAEQSDAAMTPDPTGTMPANAGAMPGAHPGPEMSYNSLASKYSNDSVQLFSLDTPGVPVTKAPAAGGPAIADAAMTPLPGPGGPAQGLPSSTDSSVTVFPFGDDTYGAGIRPGMMPGALSGRHGTPMTLAADGTIAGPEMMANAETVYFGHGSAELGSAARLVIAKAAKHYSGIVSVEGHASHRAKAKNDVQRGIINLEMSMKRAMVVTKKLIKDGVPPESIRTVAHGDSQPAVPEVDRASEAKNRRVEILTGAP